MYRTDRPDQGIKVKWKMESKMYAKNSEHILCSLSFLFCCDARETERGLSIKKTFHTLLSFYFCFCSVLLHRQGKRPASHQSTPYHHTMQTVTFTLELSTCFLFLQIFLTFCGHGVYSTIKYIDITHFPFCWLADVIKYYHDSWLSTFCKVCSETKNKLLSIKKMNIHTTHKSNGFTWWTRNILCFFV